MTMRALDTLMVLTPILMILIALGLSCALALALRGGARIACRRRTGASRAGASQAAGDPFLFPFGDVTHADREIANYRRELREDDFRAWGLPPVRPTFGRRPRDKAPGDPIEFSSACAPRRKSERGGRPFNPDDDLGFAGTAVVLKFGRRGL